MKKLYIKNISIKKNDINVSVYEKGTQNILKYNYPNNKNSLNIIFVNLIKKVWDCYPSANNGLWCYLQCICLKYCKENNIYVSNKDSLDINSPVFNLFISSLNKHINERQKYVIRTENGFYLEKKNHSFDFKLTERNLNSYKFSFYEKELFKLLNENNPIYSKIIIETV